MNQTKTILGITFTVGPAPAVVEAGLRGGLVVVPSAPVMVALASHAALREALLDADVAITDSGLMVLLWRILQRESLTRVSGLAYLRLLVRHPAFTGAQPVFWVMPNAPARELLLRWLHQMGMPGTADDCYVAPFYGRGRLTDPELLAQLQRRRPAHVVIGLGGGVQERLGYYLKHALDYRPGIHCLGGAVGFLTGDQVRIPRWADRFYLGWFFRSLSNPARFVPRYWHARRLVALMWRYREKLPPLQGVGGG